MTEDGVPVGTLTLKSVFEQERGLRIRQIVPYML